MGDHTTTGRWPAEADRAAAVPESPGSPLATVFGRDLLHPMPGWPIGHRARARRAERRRIAVAAAGRRAALWGRLDQPPAAGRPGRTPTRVSRRLVPGALVLVVLAVFTLAVTRPARPPHQPASAPPVAEPGHPGQAAHPTNATPTANTGPADSVPPLPSISALPAVTGTPPWPTAIVPVPVPVPIGDPTPGELGTPEAAMTAWLRRWCPFTHTEPYGTPEHRSRRALTDAGWLELAPAGNRLAERAWRRSVAARETGHCSDVTVHTPPEAPRTDQVAVVTGAVYRQVTSPGAALYIEQLLQTRFVVRGEDGLWRVDVAAVGG